MKGIKVKIPETGKEVILREPQISDQELAAQSVGSKAGDAPFVFVMLLNKEILRLIIHSIDGKPLDAQKLLKLDDYLTMQEYNRLLQVVGKITGNESPLAPQIESVSLGDS